MSNENYGILHTHSEYSVRDSAMKIDRMFERAKELGATALALTDHGVLVGFYEFMKAGKQYGIKAIPGVEAYFIQNYDSKSNQHLILMAKDLIGFQAICDATVKAYSNQHNDVPRMTFDILQDVFGPGAAGHGHVIATSACMQGVLSQIILSDYNLRNDVSKIYAKRDKQHPIDTELLDAIKTEEDMLHEIDMLVQRRNELTETSKINFNGLKRRLKTLDSTTQEYKDLLEKIERQTREKEQAKADLTSIKKEIAAKKRARTEYSASIKKMKESADKWAMYDEQAAEILSQAIGDEKLYEQAKEVCLRFTKLFGDGNFYVELQYHRISEEKKCMPVLAKLARELHVPVVAANDAHYASNQYKEVRARTLVAAMRFNKPIVEDVEGFGELYMKSEEELRTILLEILDEDIVSEALQNIRVIINACDVQLEHKEHYPVFTGGIPGETASQRLRRLAEAGIAKRYPGKWTKEYQERMDYELSVIDKMGYSDYLCIVQDFLEYGRSLAYNCPEKIGYTIGPGRGSAVGSIVCYLSGITSVDPMRYGLLFERFLNPERVSMPDIDSDFATTIRDTVVEYVKTKYRIASAGKDANPICNIITKGTLAGRSAIRRVGSVTEIPASLVDSVARMMPEEPKAKIDDIRDIETICASNPVINQLINDSKLVEGTVINYGVHAAGIIISDNGDVGKYVPLMYNSQKELWVAQCDMVQCEKDAGLLKMDFLGLKNLDIITNTLRLIYRNYRKHIDIESVPIEKEVFASIFATGNTNCIFQFESNGMKDMLRQFQPNSMEDIILLVAAYRPGPMQYIPEIISVKHRIKTPEYIADGLEEILAPTYGKPIYQEQVMQIFNQVAGFSLGESDIIRRIMSKKKINELTDSKTNYRGKFIAGLLAHGATQSKAEEFWDQLLDFASYAFNKSHAAAYAHIAYYTAWLKYHYPAEYMCSVMNWAEFKKLPILINECRKLGLSIEAPDINLSFDDFSNTSNSIRFGFASIKGVGNSGASIVSEREKGQFTSVKDFITRMIVSYPKAYDKTVMENLIKAGAFDVFCSGNRASLLQGINDFSDIAKKLLQKKATVTEKENALNMMKADSKADYATIKKAERSLEKAKESLATQNDLYIQHTFPLVPEDKQKKLNEEYDLLGLYLSGSPFDDYQSAASKIPSHVPIVNVIDADEARSVVICGIVKEFKLFQRKKDGAHFASFVLFDNSAEVLVKCFTNCFEKYESIITEQAALTICGKVKVDKKTMNDGTEIDYGLFIFAEEVYVLTPERKGCFILTGDTLYNYYINQDAIREYEDPNGYTAYFNDLSERRLRVLEYKVSESIAHAKFRDLLISKSELI